MIRRVARFVLPLVVASVAGCSGRASTPGVVTAGFPPPTSPRYPPSHPQLTGTSGMIGAGYPGWPAGAPGPTIPPETFPEPIQAGAYVREVAQGIPSDIVSSSGTAVFSPDGEWYAYGNRTEPGGEATLHVGRVSGQAEATQYVTSGAFFWSHDGNRLIFTQQVSATPHRYALRTWDASARRFGTILDQVPTSNPWAAWVDGGVLYSESQLYGDAPGAEALMVKPHDGIPARIGSLSDRGGSPPGSRGVYPSRDGKRVAFLAPVAGFTAAASLVVADLQQPAPRAIRRVPREFGPLEWAPSGDALGYIGGAFGRYELHRLLVADGTLAVTPFYLGEPIVEQGPNWRSVSGPFASNLSPDLKWCLVNRGGPLYARELESGRHVQLTSGRVHPISWTSDSRFVFVYSRVGSPERTRYYKVQVDR